MKKLYLFAVCGLAFSIAAAPLLAQSDQATLPPEAKVLIPEKTEILALASADLNGDELPDYVAVTQETNSADPEDPTRTVLLIEQQAAGKFAVATQNDKAVISRRNGGLSDSFDGVTAAKKTFSISHAGGRRDKWHATYTFGYSRIDRAWQLIRVEGTRWSEEGKTQTFKPPHDFGKIAFEDFDAEKWQAIGDGYRRSRQSQPPIPQ